MKKLHTILIFATLFAMNTSFTSAQISLSININSQPLWGPVAYDYVEYYYLPEYDIYYYTPTSQFVYLKGNKWLFSSRLPYHCRHADLYSTYKVVINEPKPYLRNEHFSNYYIKFKHDHSKQAIIRDSHDSKYTDRKDHPNNSHNNATNSKQKKTDTKKQKSENSNSSKEKGNKHSRK